MRNRSIKLLILIGALITLLTGCAMDSSLEPNSLKGPVAEKGWAASSRTTINNVYFQSANNPNFYLGLVSGGGVSGPYRTEVVVHTNRSLWTINNLYGSNCTIGNLELRQIGGASGPVVIYLVGNSSSPTRWTFTEIQPGYYTIRSGSFYLAAGIGGGVSGPIQAAATVSTNPYIWIVNTAY